MARLKVHYGAWVLVGDGQKSLLLHNEGDAELLNLRRLSVHERPGSASGEAGIERKTEASATPAAHDGTAGFVDWRHLDESAFAATVCEELNGAARDNAYRELIIVAPPKTLAEIRRDLSEEAHKRVVAEIPKDLTHHTIPSIENLLASHEMD